jgi:hypothetical protein
MAKRQAKAAPPRETKETVNARDRFLKLIGQGASATTAAAGAGISRATAYRWRQENGAFRDAWDGAKEEGLDRLEDRALKMAHSGNERLIMFLLEAGRPEKYRKSYKLDHSGSLDVNADEVRSAIQGKLARIALGGAARKVAR